MTLRIPSRLASALALLMTLGLVVIVYRPGLGGGFLFDDFRNLEDLGAYGGIRDWETFSSFVLGGWSGPAGRPLSLLSFLIDDTNWPSEAARFKPTNLAIHLLCGLFLIWATLSLLRVYGVPEAKAQWFAVFSGACWLLHPYLVSTTLYVVQRMAQLAALFVFAGLTGYLHGRRLLPSRPAAATLWMGGSLVIGTVLATLSKENGVLLPLLAGVIEFCAPAEARRQGPSRGFLALFMGLPALVIAGYLASMLTFAEHPWPTRNFNQIERVLSQTRIVWDYLGNLYLPRIEGQGLYHDDFVVSRNLLVPAATLPALLGLLALVAAAVSLRQRWPLFSLAVLFFLVGHLLESTVIGLELYFEHRNYLPAAFLFLPLASGLDRLGQRFGRSIPVLAALVLIGILATFTGLRARLWADTDRLELYWASRAVDSPRAQNALAAFYIRQGHLDAAQQRITEAARRLPDSALLTMRVLVQQVWVHEATPADFVQAAERLAQQPFDAQAVVSLRELIDHIAEPEQPAAYRIAALDLLDRLQRNAVYNRFPLFVRLVPYLRAQIYLAEKAPAEAEQQFRDAMDLYDDADAGLQMVALMASQGYPKEALNLLDRAEAIYRNQPDRTLKHPRTFFDREFPRFRKTLEDDLVAH